MSDGTQQFSFKPFAGFALGVLTLVAAAEVLLRVRCVRDRLPMPNPYYIADVEGKARLMEATLREHGRVDVLFIGSSVVGRGFDAELFDAELRRLDGVDVVSFNGWMSGLKPSCVAFYLDRFWAPNVTPRIIFQGVRLVTMDADALPEEYSAFQRGRYERLWMESPSAIGRLSLWALDHMRLYHYRSFLPEYLRDFRLPPHRIRGAELTPRGQVAQSVRPAEAKDITGLPTEEDLARLGWYTLKYEGERGGVRLKKGKDALRRTAAWCRGKHVAYVLVNIPEHRDRFSAPEGPALYAAYLADMRVLADELGAGFVDVTGGDTGAYGDDCYDFDHFHMSRHGSERFTREFAAAAAPLLRKWVVRAQAKAGNEEDEK